MAPDAAYFIAAQTAPMRACRRFSCFFSVQNPFSKSVQVRPGADACRHPDDRNRLRPGSRARGSRFRLAEPLLDEKVSIDAAKAEAVDGGAARHAFGAALPGPALAEDLERAALQHDLARGLLEIRHW